MRRRSPFHTDTLDLHVVGPADLGDEYSDEAGVLYSGKLNQALAPGESEDYDIPAAVVPGMMKDFGVLYATLSVGREVTAQTVGGKDYTDRVVLGDVAEADFALTEPMNMTLSDVSVEVDQTKAIDFTMALGDRFGADADVSYAVDDLNVARIENGKVLGVAPGTATLSATHNSTGATVQATVTVAGDSGGSSSGEGGGGGGRSAGVTNPVNLPASIDNGSASSSVSQARAGQTVTVTLTPDEGYQVAQVVVTDRDGGSIPVTVNHDGTYSFTMPDGPVTVTPSFIEIGEPASGGRCLKDAACPISQFTDASPAEWYHDGVHWALDEGVMNGVGDGLFAPGDSTTRAMIVTMLWRAEGRPEAASDAAFSDVPDGEWYTDAVNWAAEKEIVKGYSDDAFGPMDSVTREQLAAILYRYAQYKGVDVSVGEDANILSYDDALSVSDWAMPAMQWAVGAGIINGKTAVTLNPVDNASRAEVATMLMRFAETKTA